MHGGTPVPGVLNLYRWWKLFADLRLFVISVLAANRTCLESPTSVQDHSLGFRMIVRMMKPIVAAGGNCVARLENIIRPLCLSGRTLQKRLQLALTFDVIL